MSEALRNPELWKYVSIPFVAAVVGWATNWVAVKMTFYPLEFVGIRPIFGWQGIIPSKAVKMAATFVDTTMSRLGTLPEVFQEMEPEAIAEHISDSLVPYLDDYTDEIVSAEHAALWEGLPSLVKSQIYARVRSLMPSRIEGLVEEVGANVEDLVDLKDMITRRLVGDKQLLNRLFLESGAAEFKFIIRSGFYFGFLFGLVQLAVWIFVQQWWVLPVFGLLVGYATNWIALNLIFRPLRPRKIGPWVLHGLFLRRQPEVAAVWCGIVTREIFTIRNLVEAMLNGPRSERAHALIRRHMRPVVDETVGVVKGMAQFAVGLEGFARLRKSVADKAVAISNDPFDDRLFDEERAMVVERFLRQRMESLPSEEFQDLLRPCFQEDELKLILLGAALGLLAGFAQLFLVFGGIGGP